MDRQALELLRSLLTGERLLALAVVVEGEPVAGILPFLADGGLDSLLIHVSGMARHSRGLSPGSRVSVAIHHPLGAGDDALRAPRLLADARVEEVSAEQRPAIATAWTAAFPSAAMTVGLGDFVFRRLRLESARLVAGFAQAHGVTAHDLEAAASLAD